MPTYITLARYTQKGIENIKQSPSRLDQAKKLLESVGGKFKGFFLTMGQYDIVLIAEFPDDAAVAKMTLALGSAGNVRTETLCAFTEEEYRKIIKSLP